jgi:hypothetical protein
MGAPISIADLDRLSGELLPERSVLSVIEVSNVYVGGRDVTGPTSTSTSGGSGGGDGAGSTALSSCTTTSSPGTPGLLGSLGLGSSQPYTSVTCTPAAVAD